MAVVRVVCVVYDQDDSTHHPEEGSCGELCILLDGGQDAEDEAHQDHDEAAGTERHSSGSYQHRLLTVTATACLTVIGRLSQCHETIIGQLAYAFLSYGQKCVL